MKNANELKKMDDLGRIIIPKRIRNILGIRENDYFEVFYDDNGVYFKKYNNIGGNMKIELDLDNTVYLDFTDCKTEIFKLTLIRRFTYFDGTARWDIRLIIPKFDKGVTLTSFRGTKYDAVAEAYHLMGHHTDFEKWSYELYKEGWCKQRGYHLNDADENGFNGGECYACLEEYLDNDFPENKEQRYMQFEKIRKICKVMVSEGCQETTQADWFWYFTEIKERFNLTCDEFDALKHGIIICLEMFFEEVCEVSGQDLVECVCYLRGISSDHLERDQCEQDDADRLQDRLEPLGNQRGILSRCDQVQQDDQ